MNQQKTITTVLKNTFHLSLLPFHFSATPFHFSVFTSYLFTFAISLFTLNSCTPTEPPKPEKPKLIELKEITKSCTEIFIKVSTKDTLLPVNVTIKRDGKEIINYYQTKADTVIADTGLTENKIYGYQAIVEGKGEEGKSKEVEVITLPVTSGNFTWEKYTFGYGGINIFKDVEIIDDNNIWVVGEYNLDTTGHAYNAVHWNGEKWEVKKITTKFHGYDITVPLEGVHSFSKNDIWFVGSLPIHWNGVNAIMYDLRTTTDPNLSLSKVWGDNTKNMFFVGRNGSLAHYDGTNWRKIENGGSNYNFYGLYGSTNPLTGETEILCCGHNGSKGSELLRINNNLTVEKLDKQGLKYAVDLWFKSGIRYYIVGDGLFEKSYFHNDKWVNLNANRKITSNFMNEITGNDLNDIFVSGAYGEILHYNGLEWRSIKTEETALKNGNYNGLAVQGDLLVAVGYDDTGAIILVGKRN